MDINKFKKQCEISIKDFEKRVLPFAYIENGILLWEGFAFCAMADLFDIDIIIESGIAGGRSTEIWGRYFDKPIFGIDNANVYGIRRFNETKNRLVKYDHITCINGDANIEVLKLIKKYPNSKIGLFFDGPKGKNAVNLAKKCFDHLSVKFVGIHDECKKERYHEMDEWDKTVFYTDSKWFMDKYSYLDKNSNPSILKKELEKNPNGPGIGFAINI